MPVSIGERFLMSRLGYEYTLRLAPRIDRVLIPRTHGRFSSLGFNRVGMLTSTGAKTGARHTNPVLFIRVDDGLLLVGSNYGRPMHPSWSANLIAHPECEVEFLAPRAPYRAELMEGEDRERVWKRVLDYSVAYQAYADTCAPRKMRIFHLTATDNADGPKTA